MSGLVDDKEARKIVTLLSLDEISPTSFTILGKKLEGTTAASRSGAGRSRVHQPSSGILLHKQTFTA
jgi:hypothetical protein